MASCAGCAAKLSPLALKRVLQPLQDKFAPANFPQLTVGLGEPDDAAVYQLSEAQAIIQTVDFFPPVVDDPYWFGAIAAANARNIGSPAVTRWTQAPSRVGNVLAGAP